MRKGLLKEINNHASVGYRGDFFRFTGPQCWNPCQDVGRNVGAAGRIPSATMGKRKNAFSVEWLSQDALK